jgi:hypothetical protein
MAAASSEWTVQTQLQPDGVILRLALVGAVGAAVSLCILFFAAGRARIDDLRGDGVRLIAVDGLAPRRAQNPYVTVVPVALVEPGRHTFGVHVRGASSDAFAETLRVSASVEAGKTYRFQAHDGTVQLAEDRSPK